VKVLEKEPSLEVPLLIFKLVITGLTVLDPGIDSLSVFDSCVAKADSKEE